MSIIEVGDIIQVEEEYRHVSMTTEDKLKWCAVRGEWEEVEKLYIEYPVLCTIDIAIIINQGRGKALPKKISRGTALHLAVSDNNEKVVRNLVNSIIKHNKMEALERKNEKGDTPLHLAASRGFRDICELIIGQNGERKYLIDIGNNNGESPLFVAALFWRKQTFLYLFNFKPSKSDNVDGGSCSYSKDLFRNNGDSILHCAIRKDFFDLALIIVHKYPDLAVIPDKHEFSPIKLLATRPSAFKSGSKMIWWKRILYHCVPVGILDVGKAVEYYGMKQHESSLDNKCPKNYNTCYLFFHKCLEFAYPSAFGYQDMVWEHYRKSISLMPSERKILPENYATCLWFLKFAYICVLGLSGVGVEEITKMKQKHKWSGQLLKRFMMNPFELYNDTGVKPTGDVSETNLDEKNEIVPKLAKDNNNGDLKIYETLISETAILTAARNGIVEIVNELITKIPHSIYEVNSENKNVLLVAVENRRTIVVETLRKRFEESNKKTIFDDLIQGVDNDDNTVLHLAAKSDQDWNISGAALKMMWHFKWFQYTKGLVPKDYTVRINRSDKTAGELFKQSYSSLIQEGSTWFKETSESCSVVAALLAGVSFATSSTIPGGNNSETGKPTLEGRPAFDAFALSSVVGLCCSVTALILFLSILTSRKEPRDFRIDLPRKLLLGLTFLFLSIVAMITAFCSGNYFVLDHKFKHIVFLIYAYTCFPVTLYAVAQLPLYTDLLRGIVSNVPETGDKGEDL